MTASPRANCPSTRMTPAGNRLLPARKALTAPASMVRVPFGSRDPAIHRLRAVTGLAGVRNQVQRPPSDIACSGCSILPDAISIWVPPVVAILADSILVRMPPRDNSDSAAPAIASISEVTDSTIGVSFALGLAAGGAA